MRILIIEKNEMVAELLKERFLKNNVEVFILDETKDLNVQVKLYQPDVILCGYFLSNLNSLEVLKFIKSNFKNIKFYSMSTYPYLDVDKILSLGADGFLNKNEGLAKIVEKVISSNSFSV